METHLPMRVAYTLIISSLLILSLSYCIFFPSWFLAIVRIRVKFLRILLACLGPRSKVQGNCVWTKVRNHNLTYQKCQLQQCLCDVGRIWLSVWNNGNVYLWIYVYSDFIFVMLMFCSHSVWWVQGRRKTMG